MKQYTEEDFWRLAQSFQEDKFKFIENNINKLYEERLKEKKWYETKKTVYNRCYQSLEKSWIQLQITKLRIEMDTK